MMAKQLLILQGKFQGGQNDKNGDLRVGVTWGAAHIFIGTRQGLLSIPIKIHVRNLKKSGSS